MKKLNIKKLKEEIKSLNLEESVQDILINNVELYNDLIEKYKNGEKVSEYLIYQINGQIIKQIHEFKKLNLKINKSNSDDSDFIEKLNNKIDKK